MQVNSWESLHVPQEWGTPKDGLEAQFKTGGKGKTQNLRDWAS